jgi:hypothetical protein
VWEDVKIYSVGTDPPASRVDFPYWIDPEPLARPPSDVAACYIYIICTHIINTAGALKRGV